MLLSRCISSHTAAEQPRLDTHALLGVCACSHATSRTASTKSFKSRISSRQVVRKQPDTVRRFCRLHCDAVASEDLPQIVLTRERGKNGKLAKALQKKHLDVLEVPLVETALGPDRDLLARHLTSEKLDWVVITSPEAANVFLQCWKQAEQPQTRIAVVGQGTGDVLRAENHPALNIEYTPRVANAVHLSAGLPHVKDGNQKVLYPSSAKAGSDLQTGLLQRGFEVIRLHTYDTQPVQDIDPDVLQKACQASVLTFASPSAVKAWRKLTAGKPVDDMAIACIGSTTAIAAEKQGFRNVHYPEQPGIEGFVTAVTDALSHQHKQALQT